MTKCSSRFSGLIIGAILTMASSVPAGDTLLLLQNHPNSDLAIVHVDFADAVKRGEIDAQQLSRVQAYDTASGKQLVVQYVPQVSTDSTVVSTKGALILKLATPNMEAIRLDFNGPVLPFGTEYSGIVQLAGASMTHDAQRQAGLPSDITFQISDKAFTQFMWNDRLHHKELGGFLLRYDDQPKVSLISDGELCTVVRTEAAYQRTDGTRPTSNPRAVYDWYYFRDQPVALVNATVSQDARFTWNEVHFLELNFPGSDFTQWIGGEPSTGGELVGDSSSHRLPDWAAVANQHDAIGMFGCDTVLIHDGRGSYGTYLHAAGDRSWQTWEGTERSYSGWLWIGNAEDPAAALNSWRSRLPIEVTGVLTNSDAHAKIEKAKHDAELLDLAERTAQRWRVALAQRLEAEGELSQALAALENDLPDNWTAIPAGDLRLTIARHAGGIQAISLFDGRGNHEHLAAPSPSLFQITLRNTQTAAELTLNADRGWQTTFVRAGDAGGTELRWQSPTDTSLGELVVAAQVTPDPAHNALRWQLHISDPPEPWSLWRVRFPQVELVAPGSEPALLFPRGPGEVQTDVWRHAFTFQGTYPSGWMSMQFLASYDQETDRGLYWAIHDPLGSTKDLSAKSRQPEGTVTLSAEYPVPNMGLAGHGFKLSGEAVWQAFSGDWYDAALIYRRWVREHARWYPALTAEGRADTPMWMRELCVWAQAGGSAEQCVAQVSKFAQYLGVPVGYHWYRWHEIPFDNDYPHYFPTTDGFTDGVRSLHDANVYVMPYINGRLWDTRDRGSEDFAFTSRALSAATKDDKGEPFTETYGSKESDGSPVRLAVMCPTTSTWQNEVNGIVSKLFQQCDVDGVYIDQIAAAAPTTCMDPTHGHPLGGGHWWNQGYETMLEQIRRDMQPDQMLTSECNAEPFLRWFDGYLTWHWQYDGQVPAFPAIYGGAIQMFGRAYRGGDTRDLALRMKSAQQLVYGEQIGWMHPGVVDQPENAAFLRQVVRLRWQLRRYFYAGEMLRPPTLAGPTARVRADWQWQDNWWVETDALLTGAWHLPRENKLVAIFANVSDQPLQARWRFDAAANGMNASRVKLTRMTSDGVGESEEVGASFEKTWDFPPRSAWAVEVVPAD